MVFTRFRAHAQICMETLRKSHMHETTLYAVFRAPTDVLHPSEGQETSCSACFRAHRSNSFENVNFQGPRRPLGLQGAVLAVRVRAGGASDIVLCDGL